MSTAILVAICLCKEVCSCRRTCRMHWQVEQSLAWPAQIDLDSGGANVEQSAARMEAETHAYRDTVARRNQGVGAHDRRVDHGRVDNAHVPNLRSPRLHVQPQRFPILPEQ
ncbi:hypothetical protein OH76DRAFT_1075297 [Lentinus brumalis]|uniref:Secreted protein n=1 Tax=Lentinus brumalis TaxID=2498619 RepID=A0A371DNV3_9APHY|nr:hypothetical protein OH76DRAFT_1075297 [Polyporus brumalis]